MKVVLQFHRGVIHQKNYYFAVATHFTLPYHTIQYSTLQESIVPPSALTSPWGRRIHSRQKSSYLVALAVEV